MLVVMSRLISVTIVTRLWTGELRNPGLIPGRSKIFFSSPEAFRPALGPTQLPSILWVPGVFLGLKLLGSKSDHLIPNSTDGRNVWNYTSSLLHGRHVDTFTFMLMVLIKILHTILEVLKFIHNCAVY
jgi:hypothetical protein